MSHKTNPAKASASCVFFGVILAIFSISSLYNWRVHLADREDLTRIEGRIDSIKYITHTKTGTRIHIFVRGQKQIYHLAQNDLSCWIPAMSTLKVGDSVVAFAKNELLRFDFDWLWELQRDGVLVASYEQTLAAKAEDVKQRMFLFYGTATLSAILFVVGFLLRDDSKRRSAQLN